MSWKVYQKLGDLSSNAMMEATCLKCQITRVRSADSFQRLKSYNHLYLDELEKRLICSDKKCKGKLRLQLEHQHKVEGFVGGMA